MLRQLGLLALAALPALGCAKGEQIAPGEIVILTLDPADAGADAASASLNGDLAAAPGSGTGGAGGQATTSPPAMAAGRPGAGGSAGSGSDAGTNDAGQSEDRPVDAGN